MPRRTRPYVTGVPCHVVQRGNNRQACFYRDDDYVFYINALKKALDEFNVHLHAFVLMTNHVHLLMTPVTVDGISNVMQSVGRRYVRYVNSVYHRTGTLWEGRHKASLVDCEAYLLVCYRYIELNPVRAGITQHPGEYRWSSYHANALGKHINIIKPHALYQQLGKTNQERIDTYRALFDDAISAEKIEEVRASLRHNYPLGNSKFRQQLERTFKISFGYKSRGRPKKA